MSVVLVVGASLLVRTFLNVQAINPGFSAEGIQSFRIAVRAQNRERALAFHRQLQERLELSPSVAAAASISHAPYDHVPNWGGPYASAPGLDPSTLPQADYRSLSPGALELLGVTLTEGRSFTDDDDPSAPLVAIVDTRVARRAWPGESPIGKRLGVDVFVTGKPDNWATVVGVVEHVRHRNPVAEVRDQIYFSQRQALRNPAVYIVKS